MRFPEDKIKEAILDPDLEVRDRATRTLNRGVTEFLSEFVT
jgi:hypothetical protein